MVKKGEGQGAHNALTTMSMWYGSTNPPVSSDLVCRRAPLSRQGNPIQGALHALAREGINIGSRAERNVARRNYPRSWQLQDLLLRRKPMDDTFGHQLAWGQWQEVGPAHVGYTVTQHKQLPVPGPPDQICGVNLCPKRSTAIHPENEQPFGRMRA